MSYRRTLLAALIAVGWSTLAGTSAQADMIIAQQKGDYQINNNGHADTLGTGTWHYMYADAMNPTAGTTGLLIWNAPMAQYDISGGADWYPDVKIEQANGMLTMAPEVGGGAEARYAVMRWTSGYSGNVNVNGTWTHYWDLGDGMDVAVYADGVEQFHTFLTAGSASFDFDVAVGLGSVVDYVVGPGSSFDGNYDRACIETTITPVPGAVLLGLLGLGAAGVKLRKRV